MKAPKGFGKKYFTFASILAYAVENKLQRLVIVSKYAFTNKSSNQEDEFEENDPPLDNLTLCLVSAVNKPCHCDCFFKSKTRLAVALFKFIPRCPYYCKFFAFRRTGVHPPLIIL
ncbi:hypothetical protein CP965_05780 [Halarcobacter mediterraneus]|uniref:Uncharacterized protein n=2 Tax=Halarcobacter mediterraneus TaxID=2023153 RepID=A0A4Q1AUN9_9BACT|nr:hypothetical protein CP965_05780 [Halarcobacter mediterraneus]